MTGRIKSLLPWIAVLSALAAAVLFLIGIMPQRQRMLVDSGLTRPAAEAAIDQVLAQPPAALDDADFRQSLEALPGNAYIWSVWLFGLDGQIVFNAGMVPHEGTAAEHATAETRRLLEALPPEALSGEQQTMLLVASAIRSEGEHNDVLRHLVREVRSPDGLLLGWIGVAYDVGPAMGAVDVGWIASLLAWLFLMGVYWLSLPLWVWLDARRRGERAWVWAMFVLIGNLVALMAYLLTRPKAA